MVKVNSSHLISVIYKDTLFITFKNGVTYKYFDVPISIYKELLAAPSVGSFFHKYIKNIYNSEKVMCEEVK